MNFFASGLFVIFCLSWARYAYGWIYSVGILGSTDTIIYDTVTGPNHIVTVEIINSSYYINFQYRTYYNRTWQDWQAYNFELLDPPVQPFQIRTSKLNTELQNSSFLIFDRNKIFMHSDNFTTVQALFTAQDQSQIFDAVFGENLIQTYCLVGRQYSSDLIRIESGTVTHNITIPPSNNTYNTGINKILFKLNYLITISQSNLNAFFYNSSTDTLSQVNLFNFSGNYSINDSFDVIDFDAQGDSYFAYFTQTYLEVYQLKNMSLMYYYNFVDDLNFSQKSVIKGIKFIDHDYIMISIQDSETFNSMIYQLDFLEGAVIASRNLSSGFTKMHLMKNFGQIVLSDQTWANQSHFLYKYYINQMYRCFNNTNPNGTQSCSTCLSNYYLMSDFQCKKWYVPWSTPLHYNITTRALPVSPPEQIANLTDCSNYSNTEIKKDGLVMSVIDILDSEMAQKFTDSFSKISTICNIRISPRALLSLTSFFDELNIYQYHRKDYPLTMQLFIHQSSIMNQIKSSPWFLGLFGNFTNQIFQIDLFQTRNLLFTKQLAFNYNSDPSQPYFMSSSLNLITFSILQNLLLFLVLKFVHLFLFALRNKNTNINVVYLKFKYETMWWTIVVSVFQTNISQLVFNSAIQFDIPSFFNATDKFNIIFSTIMLFCLLLYSFCFYPLTLKYFKIKSAHILLQRCDQKNSKSFNFQPVVLVFRVFLRSFTNGILILSYKTQILSLFIIDLCSFIFTIAMRKCFRNKTVFFVTSIYFLNFIHLDGYFVIQAFFDIRVQQRQLYILIITLSFLFYSMLIFLSLIIPQIYKFLLSAKIGCKPTRILPSMVEQHNLPHKLKRLKLNSKLLQNTKEQKWKDKVEVSQNIRIICKMPKLYNNFDLLRSSPFSEAEHNQMQDKSRKVQQKTTVRVFAFTQSQASIY